MKITDWSWNLEREPELCSFFMLADDPRCVICGQRCVPGMKQWHAGPVIRVSGWLETEECHEPDAGVWNGLILPKRDGMVVPELPIFVTGRKMTDESTYRYSFAGSTAVHRATSLLGQR